MALVKRNDRRTREMRAAILAHGGPNAIRITRIVVAFGQPNHGSIDGPREMTDDEIVVFYNTMKHNPV